MHDGRDPPRKARSRQRLAQVTRDPFDAIDRRSRIRSPGQRHDTIPAGKLLEKCPAEETGSARHEQL